MNIELVKDAEEKTIDILSHNLKWWYLRGYQCKNLIKTLLMFSNIEIKKVIDNNDRLLDFFDFLVSCVLKRMYRTELEDGTHMICCGGDIYSIRPLEVYYLEDAIEIINKCENVIIFLILIIKNSPCGPSTPFVIDMIHDKDPNCLKKHENQILNCKEQFSNWVDWSVWCEILISDYKKFILKWQINYS